MKLNFIENKELQLIKGKLQEACSIFDSLAHGSAVKRIEMVVMKASFCLCKTFIDQRNVDPTNKYLLECSFHLKRASYKMDCMGLNNSVQLIKVKRICEEVLKIIAGFRL